MKTLQILNIMLYICSSERKQNNFKIKIMATIIKTITTGNQVKGYNNNTDFVCFSYRSCTMNLPLSEVSQDEDFEAYGADEVYICRLNEGEKIELETGRTLIG